VVVGVGVQVVLLFLGATPRTRQVRRRRRTHPFKPASFNPNVITQVLGPAPAPKGAKRGKGKGDKKGRGDKTGRGGGMDSRKEGENVSGKLGNNMSLGSSKPKVSILKNKESKGADAVEERAAVGTESPKPKGSILKKKESFVLRSYQAVKEN
jgi:hypothetical protein